MNKVGMYGGKFLPITTGHVKCILQAATMVDELYIILSYDTKNEKQYFKNTAIKEHIPYQQRYKWLKQITKDISNVKIIALPEIYKEHESCFNPVATTVREYDWVESSLDIKNTIGKPIDIVFAGADYSPDFWQVLYPESDIFIFNRTSEDISATKIRENGPFKYWDYIPNVVKPYFTKKICVVGTESCGKSELVNKLALYYNTNKVEEYGRTICEQAGGAENMVISDFKMILCGQIIKEEEAIKYSNKLLFIDSEQMVTNYYLDLYVDDVEAGLNAREYSRTARLARTLSHLQKYDLVLLMAPTVPWVNDGTRLHGEQEVRIQNHKNLKEFYDNMGINYIEIKDDNYIDRYLTARKEIDKLL